MTLKEYILKYKELDYMCDHFTIRLNNYEKIDGLIPDKITNSENFKADKNKYNYYFKQLQLFNVATKKESQQIRKLFGRTLIKNIDINDIRLN